MTGDDVNDLVAEIGPRDDTVLAALRTGPDAWVLRYADVDVELTHDGEMQRLTLSAPLGTVPAVREAAVHRALPTYSSLWRETGGVRAALVGDEAVLILDITAVHLTAARIGGVAGNLATLAGNWREVVTAGAPVPAAAAANGDSYIRV